MAFLLSGGIALMVVGAAAFVAGRMRVVRQLDAVGSLDTGFTPAVISGLALLALGAVLFFTFLVAAMLTQPIPAA